MLFRGITLTLFGTEYVCIYLIIARRLAHVLVVKQMNHQQYNFIIIFNRQYGTHLYSPIWG